MIVAKLQPILGRNIIEALL